MNSNNGKEILRKFIKKSGPAVSIGINNVTKIMIKIITLNAIIRYLNFKANTPIITYCKIIKERLHYVNLIFYRADYSGVL